jgi:hypothetical protein
MRKKDYETLARIIRETRQHYDAHPDNGNVRYGAVIEALDHVAREFSERASVDRIAFLTACGVKP